MNASFDFSGRVALVTGAASGMGLATATAFAQSGAAVMLADINQQALAEALDAIQTAGGQATTFVCDVTSEDNVAALIKHTVATFGDLDFAFNNAGIQVPAAGAAEETAANFDKVNAINLRGVWA